MDDRFVNVKEHLLKAHALEGEHQLAKYVAQLDIQECARILAASPETLPLLAARRDECRVVPGEKRSFEEIMRTWTLSVLSGIEGG